MKPRRRWLLRFAGGAAAGGGGGGGGRRRSAGGELQRSPRFSRQIQSRSLVAPRYAFPAGAGALTLACIHCMASARQVDCGSKNIS